MVNKDDAGGQFDGWLVADLGYKLFVTV